MYRHRRQVGVNLGSIFILDKKFSPASLRSCVVNGTWESELDFLRACMTLEQAEEALEDHWSTFVTEKDFQYLSSIGINSVRIPIGYWIVDIEHGPFKKYREVYKSAWRWFLHMIHLAAQYKMGVLVDLHGAPGGQNPLSHSGTSSHRVQFYKGDNQEHTLKVLQKLTTALAPINNVIGLSLLNEPMDDALLPNFYLSAYHLVRQASEIMLPIYISDVGHRRKYMDVIQQNHMKFVILDTHFPLTRNVNTKERAHQTEEQELKKDYVQMHGNLIIGEWSAIPQEGYRRQEAFSETQLAIYTQSSAGHYFWNYRTSDDADGWSFLYCHKNRILPAVFKGGKMTTACVEGAYLLAKSRYEMYRKSAHQHYSSIRPKGHEYDVDGYTCGFREGYGVALNYLREYQSRVGFKHQLAHGYAKNGKSIEYEQAFIRALFIVDQLIAEFICT
ncbi:hypothetical protein INT47_009015 [Mucor saturninus]|uniref:Glycoside hydrolase family 5 domain-containing protein n=1 Tax=Mucor saturninus TaxID=64648 RepID=A0A8H7QTE3_9FUNG|nr:hypothetical protein INT47_009015 [Mucor saturninus]